MTQTWRNLLFLHAPIDPSVVQRLLPPGLSVDTFPDEAGTEQAWIGFVPFQMRDIQVAGLPRVAGTHSFNETNVRTYVHRDGADPGVWFFSLEASNRLAVEIARRGFHLPYHFGNVGCYRQGDLRVYRGQRSSQRDAIYFVRAETPGPLRRAEPGSRDFYFLERYLLYSQTAGPSPRLMTGRVHHTPYLASPVDQVVLRETLSRAAGLPPLEYRYAAFSPGVEVEIFGLRSGRR